MDLRNIFPNELIELFVSYMEVNGKRRLRATSRYWFSFVKIDEFKLYFANPTTIPDIVQHFAKYYDNIPIGLSLIKIVAPNFEKLPVEHFARLTNLTSLAFNTPESSGQLEWVEQASKLATLTNLQRISRIPLTSTLINLTSLNLYSADLQYFTLYSKLEQLEMNNVDNTVLSLLPNPSRLTGLTICSGWYEIFKDADSARVFARYSNLKNLSIQQDSHIDFKYLTRLESLEICRSNVSSDLFRLTQLTNLTLVLTQVTRELESISKLVNLKYFSLRSPYVPEIDYTFVSGLTALESFNSTAPQKGDLIQYRSLNSNKLTQVRTGNVYDDSIGRLTTLLDLFLSGYSSFNYEVLTGLKHLTKLWFSTQEAYSEKLSVLNQLESLKWLIIPGTTDLHKDVTFKNLTNLECLMLSGKVSLNMYNALASMTRLTSLIFRLPSDVWLTNTTLLMCLTQLRQLVFKRQLHYAQSHREPNDVAHLVQVCTKLPELEHLEMWKVSSEASIESLSVLTKLTRLVLNRTRHVEGIHLTKLTSLQSLTFLSKKARVKYYTDGDFLTEKLTRLISQQFAYYLYTDI